jgi:hypothetical protein
MQSQIEIFKFNPSTDYLPYFKKVFLKIDCNWTILKLLEEISKVENFVFLNSEKFCLKINDIFVDSKTNLNIFKNLEFIRIEPVSEYFCKHDLIVDTSSFWNKFNKIQQFDKNGDLRNLYEDNFLEYFASNSLNLNKNYIGEAVLSCIHKLIFENEIAKNEFSEIICEPENGILFHTSLKNQIVNNEKNEQIFKDLVGCFYPNKISNLKKIDFLLDKEIIQNFDHFNVGFYFIYEQSRIFTKHGINEIELSLKNLNFPSFCEDKDFIFKFSAIVLLEAIDKNCDFLIVDDGFIFELFDTHQKQIENVANRDIKLPILKIDEFAKILNGENNSKIIGLDQHKVPVNFL